MFGFLRELLKAWREWMRYQLAVRHAKRTHINADLLIYCVKRTARETTPGIRVSMTLETRDGRLTISADTERHSAIMSKEDALFEEWKNARNSYAG